MTSPNVFAETIQIPITTTAGREEVTLRQPVAFLRFVGLHPVDLYLYAGYGTSIPICRIRAWEHRDIELNDATDTLTVIWPDNSVTTPSTGVIVSFLAAAGRMETTGGQASGVTLSRNPGDEPLVWASAGNDVATLDEAGYVVLAKEDPLFPGQIVPYDWIPGEERSYFCGFQRSARDFSSNVAFAGPGLLVLATVWLTDPFLELKLLSVDAAVMETTAAIEAWLTLVRINTHPTGGTSHVIEPYDVNGSSGAECRRLPSGGAAINSESLGTATYKLGVTGAVSTVNPAPPVEYQPIYRSSWESEQRPNCFQGQGFAIVGDVNAAATVRMVFRMKWTEGDI